MMPNRLQCQLQSHLPSDGTSAMLGHICWSYDSPASSLCQSTSICGSKKAPFVMQAVEVNAASEHPADSGVGGVSAQPTG